VNHAFITLKRDLPSPAAFGVVLNEIVTQKWGSAVEVEQQGNDRWHIRDREQKGFMGLALWFKSTRKIEMRRGPGDLSGWLQTYMQESIAIHLKGSCGDEGVGYKWKPTPVRYGTFELWFKEVYRGSNSHPIDPALIQDLFDQTLAQIPKELLGIQNT
jgi:hypothetical protein